LARGKLNACRTDATQTHRLQGEVELPLWGGAAGCGASRGDWSSRSSAAQRFRQS